MMHISKFVVTYRTYSACRREELTCMTINDVDDSGSVVIITVLKKIQNTERSKQVVWIDTFEIIPKTISKYVILLNLDVRILVLEFFLTDKPASRCLQLFLRNSTNNIGLVHKYFKCISF